MGYSHNPEVLGYIKIFDGECDNTDAQFSPGTLTLAGCNSACFEANAIGFIVSDTVNSDGDRNCYCEFVDSATCSRLLGTTWDRYDITTGPACFLTSTQPQFPLTGSSPWVTYSMGKRTLRKVHLQDKEFTFTSYVTPRNEGDWSSHTASDQQSCEINNLKRDGYEYKYTTECQRRLRDAGSLIERHAPGVATGFSLFFTRGGHLLFSPYNMLDYISKIDYRSPCVRQNFEYEADGYCADERDKIQHHAVTHQECEERCADDNDCVAFSFISDGTEQYLTTSGSPDMSMTEADCEAYATEKNKAWEGAISSSTIASGCQVTNVPTPRAFYNTDTNTNPCYDGYHMCVQSRPAHPSCSLSSACTDITSSAAKTYRVDAKSIYYGKELTGNPLPKDATTKVTLKRGHAGRHLKDRNGHCSDSSLYTSGGWELMEPTERYEGQKCDGVQKLYGNGDNDGHISWQYKKCYKMCSNYSSFSLKDNGECWCSEFAARSCVKSSDSTYMVFQIDGSYDDMVNTWVDRAFDYCMDHHPTTNFVSVWRDAGFRCYDTCDGRTSDSRTVTYSKAGLPALHLYYNDTLECTATFSDMSDLPGQVSPDTLKFGNGLLGTMENTTLTMPKCVHSKKCNMKIGHPIDYEHHCYSTDSADITFNAYSANLEQCIQYALDTGARYVSYAQDGNGWCIATKVCEETEKQWNDNYFIYDLHLLNGTTTMKEPKEIKRFSGQDGDKGLVWNNPTGGPLNYINNKQTYGGYSEQVKSWGANAGTPRNNKGDRMNNHFLGNGYCEDAYRVYVGKYTFDECWSKCKGDSKCTAFSFGQYAQHLPTCALSTMCRGISKQSTKSKAELQEMAIKANVPFKVVDNSAMPSGASILTTEFTDTITGCMRQQYRDGGEIDINKYGKGSTQSYQSYVDAECKAECESQSGATCVKDNHFTVPIVGDYGKCVWEACSFCATGYGGYETTTCSNGMYIWNENENMNYFEDSIGEWVKLPIGNFHILGSGYGSYTSVTSQEECITTCEENGYSLSSFATNSVKCRCGYAGYNHEWHDYSGGGGTGVYMLGGTRPATLNNAKSWSIHPVQESVDPQLPNTAYDGEGKCLEGYDKIDSRYMTVGTCAVQCGKDPKCDSFSFSTWGGHEFISWGYPNHYIRMYDGRSHSWNSNEGTWDETFENCFEACATEKRDKNSAWHNNFYDSVAVHTNPVYKGRCYCSNAWRYSPATDYADTTYATHRIVPSCILSTSCSRSIDTFGWSSYKVKRVKKRCKEGTIQINEKCYDKVARYADHYSDAVVPQCVIGDCDSVRNQCTAEGGRLALNKEINAWIAYMNKIGKDGGIAYWGLTDQWQGKNTYLQAYNNFHPNFCCSKPNHWFLCITEMEEIKDVEHSEEMVESEGVLKKDYVIVNATKETCVDACAKPKYQYAFKGECNGNENAYHGALTGTPQERRDKCYDMCKAEGAKTMVVTLFGACFCESGDVDTCMRVNTGYDRHAYTLNEYSTQYASFGSECRCSNTSSSIQSNAQVTQAGLGDFSVSEAECEAFAVAHTNLEYQQFSAYDSLPNSPTGCFMELRISSSNFMTYYYYNRAETGVACVQNGDHLACIKTVRFERTAELVEVTSGYPDLSVSEAECEAYATKEGKLFSIVSSSTINRPSGCMYHAFVDNIKYNTDLQSIGVCGDNTNGYPSCLQKGTGKLLDMKTHKVIHTKWNGTEYGPTKTPVSSYYVSRSGYSDTTMDECKAYSKHMEIGRWDDRPHGCVHDKGVTSWNTMATSLLCSSYPCIKRLEIDSYIANVPEAGRTYTDAYTGTEINFENSLLNTPGVWLN